MNVVNTASDFHGGSHHASHGALDWLLHGFLWRLGSDAANTLFHAAPGLTLAGAVIFLALAAGRRWRRRGRP